MKHTKRIFSFLVAALLIFGIAAPLAHAAPSEDIQILSMGGDEGIFEIFNGLEWKSLTVPFFMDITDGNVAFCLESEKSQPFGDSYSVSQAFYSASVLAGVRSIIIYGYPNNRGGLTEAQCWYATQTAIWTFMWEAAGVGYESYAEHNLRATAGNQAVYAFYQLLLERARLGMDEAYRSYWYTPPTVVLTPNGSGQLSGTAVITLEGLDTWSVDQSKLPAGVSITGVTYRDQDTFTVTVPMSYAGRTEVILNCFQFQGTRSPANVFWYEPGGGNLQKMVVFDMSLQTMHSGGVTFTSEDIKQGRITVRKTNANPSAGDYSLAGAVFEIFTGERVLVDTVTTGADGTAQSKLLDLGRYIVAEKTAPTGYVRNSTDYGILLDQINPNLGYALAYVDVPEQPQVGVIRVSKSNANPEGGDHSLAGAVFEVRDAAGALIDTTTTDAQGKAQSKQLPLGEYKITEKTAPEGFLVDTQIYTASLVYGSQSVEVVYADVNVPEQPQQGIITIRKINSNPPMGDHSLADAVFEIYSGSTLADTVTTDATGAAQSKRLPLGEYEIIEITAPYGFTRNPAVYRATLEYAGQNAELAYVTVNFPNNPQAGVIRLTKTNSNPAIGDYSLAGAVFEIRDSEGKLIDTITTDNTGKANSKKLPLGSYTVTEKTAPHGFVRNQNTFGAQLIYAGQNVEVVYADVIVAEQPQLGTITVTKCDAVTGETTQGDAVLTGAVFEVFALVRLARGRDLRRV